MRIGGVELKRGLALAPMAGVTDRAFRTVCRKYGAEYAVTEMISSKGIHYGDKKTFELAGTAAGDKPLGIQIFGSDRYIMAEAAAKLASAVGSDVIDINMGCPARKIACNGDGSSLMRNTDRVRAVVREVCSALPGTPVTVKIRTGWDAGTVNAVAVALAAQEAGAAAVCVHGRTREQMYAPPVDFKTIADVKTALDIPVFGNGGIMNASDALEMFGRTRCDGIMVARGAEGNPWIFAQIADALDGKPVHPPEMGEIVETARLHMRLLVADKGEYTGVREGRRHLASYFRGFAGAAALRGRINACLTFGDIEELLDGLAV